MKNEYDYGWMRDLVADSMGHRVLRGLQTDLNVTYGRNYRAKKQFTICGNKVTFSIVLPDGSEKKFKVVVTEA